MHIHRGALNASATVQQAAVVSAPWDFIQRRSQKEGAHLAGALLSRYLYLLRRYGAHTQRPAG